MTITADVKNQLFRQSSSSDGEKLIRLPHESGVAVANAPANNTTGPSAVPSSPQNASNGKAWTREEHERFLEGLELFPSGPWKEVAAFVGTRTTRQTMTHAQKYREKIARRKRGLRGSASAQPTPLQARSTQGAGDDKEQYESTKQQQSERALASIEVPSATSFQQQLKSVHSSPTSVVMKAEQMLEDPLDFDGCFMELDHESSSHFHQFGLASDFALDQTLLVSLAASEGCDQQLTLSDEDMDLIMDSVFKPVAPSSSSLARSSSLQNAFSFVC
ncbi:Myb-like dna-binding protein [Globisporangium polare]